VKGKAMTRKILVLFLLLPLLASCGRWSAVRPLPAAAQSVPTSERFMEKNYKIGETRTAFIGQEIIRIHPYTKSKRIVYDKNASSDGPLYVEMRDRLKNYTLRSDMLKDYLIKESIEVENYKYNIIKLLDNNNTEWGILVDDNGDIFKNGLYSYYHKLMLYPNSISITPVIITVSLQKREENENLISGASFEIIYSGKNDISLNVTYREYSSDNMARTAFFQNITYRPDAKDIRFKDFVIQIHDASNEKITYTVLQDGLN
jgi:hypothetical protein